MPKQVTAPRFLRLPEVLNLVGVTRSTLYRWMEAETFPRQISVGGEHRRLGGVRRHQVDARPDRKAMTSTVRALTGALPFFVPA